MNFVESFDHGEKFELLYPGVRIQSVQREVIPREPLEYFIRRSAESTDSPENFIGFYRLDYQPGKIQSLSWVAMEHKILNVQNYEGKEMKNIHILEYGSNNEYVGRGEVSFVIDDLDPFYINKPYVRWTETEISFQNNGLGRRRLLVMNALAVMKFSLSLHSGTIFSDKKAQKLWLGLVECGLAECYMEEGEVRYCFKAV